ncbi:MAG: alpha/beta hydrolase [Kofleriaceae bacterium]
MRRLLLLALTGCTLGGTGKPPGGDDDTSTIDNQKCVTAMTNAPLASPGFDYHDALPTASKNTWDTVTMPQAGDNAYPGGRYRTIEADANGKIHPGCSTTGLMYAPATDIAGYQCAARAFPGSEDTSKPIVILVHGNSDGPTGYMSFLHPDPSSLQFPADTTERDQLAELLPAQGFRTYAIDMRTDLVDDPMSPEGKDIGNTPKNQDHGWQVPILQHMIKQLAIQYPDRKISLVGHSLGVTVVRDALRRLWVEWADKQWDVNIYEHIDAVVLASGANHGVVSFQSECGLNLTMRGTVTCEMGQRNQYNETEFARPLNGPAIDGSAQFGGWWETPCADGDYAYGKRGVCGGHAVRYTSITMKDLANGTQQDEFVSEHASRLYPTDCANNVLDELTDFDTSGYFYNGYFRNHYGSVRSNAGIAHVIAALGGN